jgi:hypothetical protein
MNVRDDMEQIGVVLRSKWFHYGLIILASFFILALVFGAGFAVGKWTAPPFNAFRPVQRTNNFRSGHGAVGVIQSIQGQTITVQSRDGDLETVLVGNDTRFDENFEDISFGDLKVNDHIIVIGSPNSDGAINARLIGLVDPSSPRVPGRNFPSPTGSK